MERAYTGVVMTVVTKRVNLGRRTGWAVATVLGLGALTFLGSLVFLWTVWGTVADPTYDAVATAFWSAVNVMTVSGMLAFVYVGLSFGRWLSQRLEKPTELQFEVTEYPRAPLEAR